MFKNRSTAPLCMCYNPPLVRNKPLGAPTFVKLVYCTRHFRNYTVPIVMAVITAVCKGGHQKREIWWRHNMRTFSGLLALLWGECIPLTKGHQYGTLSLSSVLLFWTNCRQQSRCHWFEMPRRSLGVLERNKSPFYCELDNQKKKVFQIDLIEYVFCKKSTICPDPCMQRLWTSICAPV